MHRATSVHRLSFLCLAFIAALAACKSTPRPDTFQPTEPALAPELVEKVEHLDKRVAEKQAELGIPGLALVVVKDDRVVYVGTHGKRDAEKNLPVEQDTLFAIGSTTKAFTGMLAMMAVEAGKLSLDDHPRKCIPYFKLKDPESDKNIKVRDLMTHTSGLMRTDVGWITGKLTKEEVIKLAGLAEPVDPLGEEFHYQNVMFLAAGECVANAMGQPYEELLHKNIFEPLGMHDTNVSVAETLKLPNRAVGYAEFGDQREVAPVPMRPLDSIAPAGAINASARDMGNWLRLLLGKGKFEGKELVTESSFRKLTKRHFTMRPTVGYGLGWIKSRWRDKQMLSHGGGIDGFVTLVAFLPKENLAFGLFTNIQNGDIQGFVTEEVFSLFTDAGAKSQADAKPGANSKPSVASADEAGTYGIIGGLEAEVAYTDGKLVLTVPRQPAYELEHLEGRRYRLGPPAPAGFYAVFRPKQDHPNRRELLLEQPQGNMVLDHLTPELLAAAEKETPPAELRALLGVYRFERDGREVDFEVGMSKGRVAFIAPGGGNPNPLVIREKDKLGLAGLPEDFWVEVQRDKSGKVAGLKMIQPSETIELKLLPGTAPPKISVAKLMAKVARAHGSKRLLKHGTLTVRGKLDMVNQGLTGTRVARWKGPNRFHEDSRMSAFGREIGHMTNTFDGEKAKQEISFVARNELGKGGTQAIALEAELDRFVRHAEIYESATVKRVSTVGEEAVIVVEFRRHNGAIVTDYYGRKSYLLLKREQVHPVGREGQQAGETRTFEDYRKVKGVMIPHRVSTDSNFGKIVFQAEAVELGTDIPDTVFGAAPAKPE